MRRSRGLIVAFAAALIATAAPGLGGAAAAPSPLATYIVVLEPGASSPQAEAARLAREYGGRVGYVYEHALRGFSITLTGQGAEALARSSRVDYVEKDQVVSLAEQTTPTGIGRIFAAPAGATGSSAAGTPYNASLDIDGVDDKRVDADIAVLDTGIDLKHPDLNVIGGTNCLRQSSWETCSGTGDDDHYHGTHVAGTVAAIDNDFGVVGVAPGARLWAVKVLDRNGSGTWTGVIAGIDWVAKKGGIEVANMSLGGGYSQAVNDAVAGAVGNGVSMVVAAGNSAADAAKYSPASEPSAITVSALADFNGAPGGLGSPTCRTDVDDTFADFSNYGSVVDMIAPGVCILSTYPGERYATISGTSMASPHVAGAVALLRSVDDANTLSELLSSGNQGWSLGAGVTDDGVQEPLLDVSRSTVFAPKFVGDGGGTVTNSAPTAAFTYSCTELACDFVGAGSDTDGTVTGYSWTFGDGTGTSSVQSPTYRYASSGTYTVTLTVTDNGGATGSTSQAVTVAAPNTGSPSFVGSSSRNGKSAWKATISVTAAAGTSVSGPWSYDGSIGGCMTDLTGTCSFSLPKIPNSTGSVTWTYSADGRQVAVAKPQ